MQGSEDDRRLALDRADRLETRQRERFRLLLPSSFVSLSVLAVHQHGQGSSSVSSNNSSSTVNALSVEFCLCIYVALMHWCVGISVYRYSDALCILIAFRLLGGYASNKKKPATGFTAPSQAKK